MKTRFFKAFSLIEVAVAITVLGVVIAGIVPVINSAFRRAQISSRKATAHRLVQERIEQLRLTNLTGDFYDGLFNLTSGQPLDDASFHLLGNATLPGNETYGNLSLNISDFDDPFAYFCRLTEGSWDIDQDGNLTNEKAVTNNLYGNLSLIRVTVSWDFNNDGFADDNGVVVSTYIGQ